MWQDIEHFPIKLGFKSFEYCRLMHTDTLNILVTVKILCVHWKKMNILIHCDNHVEVCILKSEKAQDAYLTACTHKMWLWAATHDISFPHTHVSGKNNSMADLFSR